MMLIRLPSKYRERFVRPLGARYFGDLRSRSRSMVPAALRARRNVRRPFAVPTRIGDGRDESERASKLRPFVVAMANAIIKDLLREK